MCYDFIVTYRHNTTQGAMPVGRHVRETDPINAIIAARAEERHLIGACCESCILVGVKLAQS